MGKVILVAASTMAHLIQFHTPYLRALRERGHIVYTMAAGEGADFPVPFEKKCFSAHNFRQIGTIRRAVRQAKPDVVIVNTSLAAFWVRLSLLFNRKIRIINIVHGYLFCAGDTSPRARLLRRAEMFLSRRTDALLVMNDEDRMLAEQYRLGKTIRTVRGFGTTARADRTQAERIRALLARADAFVLCFTGELSVRKNEAFLIRALARVREKIAGAQLWLVGEGSEREALTTLANSLGLSGAVSFLGQRKNAVDFMAACDVYVSAARSEGSPFNVAEALTCAQAVLVSDVKGNRDVIGEGQAALRYNPDDMDDFVNKILHIYNKTADISVSEARKRGSLFSLDRVFFDTYNAILTEVEAT